MYMYLDGRYVEVEKAVISPFDDLGFYMELAVFETFRTYDRYPLFT